ncbi:hypothetical protein QYE76_026432 [Lolium multiflorum]|uniref:F-box domain-containing protein n=1 Tax=Lolium multiflorum TaxID=4521 RepID=A0AAD8VXK0_LOLMU|nr:hypothetical protein QYE76_026432 [Lolium multiflorum]
MDETDGNGNGVCFAYDVLLDILRRLPCRALAKSRAVCRAWRSIVDAHNLLHPHLFPRGAFPGIFTRNYDCNTLSSFFAPSGPGSSRRRQVHGGPVFRRPLFWHSWMSVLHHCNGLLLLDDLMFRYVCNPATVRCARLPVPSEDSRLYDDGMFLAFDPAVSQHHEVFILPRGKTLTDIGQEEIDTLDYFDYMGEFDTSSPSGLDVLAQVLPPEQQKEIHVHVPGVEEQDDKVISTSVFSSQTGEWTSREFMPGRCAPGHLYEMVTAPRPTCVKTWKSAEYWRGSLYVHCWNNIIMILRNSDGVYEMALLPWKYYDDRKYGRISELPERTIVVSYEKGVHYVALHKLQLHVWKLTESIDGQVGWMIAHKADLSPYDHKPHTWMECRVPWEVVENNKALASLFEPCKNKKTIYNGKDGQCKTTEGFGGDVDDEEKDIHEGDGFDRAPSDVDDDGHSEGDPYEDECGEFKSGNVFEYSSDSDEDNSDRDERATDRYSIVGLHPHKDVILLQDSNAIVTYHFRTSRMQYLGEWHDHSYDCGIEAAFPYRPCYVDALPATKLPF